MREQTGDNNPCEHLWVTDGVGPTRCMRCWAPFPEEDADAQSRRLYALGIASQTVVARLEGSTVRQFGKAAEETRRKSILEEASWLMEMAEKGW